MSCPSTPIFVPSRSSTPSPTPTPAPAPSSAPDPNDMMTRLIQQPRRRGQATRGRMATTPLTQEQIRRNAMEEAREYHEERSTNLTNDYQRLARVAHGHAAIIAYWSDLHQAPVSETLSAFASTPSIALPFLLNVAPPPITTNEPGIAHIEEALDDDWEVEPKTSTPPL